jgi:hypothetical protein
MEPNSIIILVLGSSVIAAIISGFISYLSAKHLLQKEFKNLYFKELLSKRLEAYEHLERQISVLKGVATEENGTAIHQIFFMVKKSFWSIKPICFLRYLKVCGLIMKH